MGALQRSVVAAIVEAQMLPELQAGRWVWLRGNVVAGDGRCVGKPERPLALQPYVRTGSAARVRGRREAVSGELLTAIHEACDRCTWYC